MVSVRTAKSKGSQFEYDCQYSLSKIYPQIYRTAERGFQRQFDLCVEFTTNVNPEFSEDVKKFYDNVLLAIECKRLKGISWNELVKFYNKLDKTKALSKVILFKSNHQPCLVFYQERDIFYIKTFKDYFNAKFEKHPSTRAPKPVSNI